MHHVLTIALLIRAVKGDDLANVGNIDWCSLKCGGKAVSTMCESKPRTETAACGPFNLTMDPTQRKVLLHLHNDFRNKIAEGKEEGWPKASDMRQLGWDLTLEVVATRWAQQCSEESDSCAITPDFKEVGQNIAILSSTGGPPDPHGVLAFHAWVKEIKHVDEMPRKFLESFSGAFDFGHFTQIIWAKTHKLGCAGILFMKSNWYNSNLFCYYGIGGNLVNDPIYQSGVPCMKCPNGTRCKQKSRYRSLCALSTDALTAVDIEGPSKEALEAKIKPVVSDAARLMVHGLLVFTVLLKTLE